MASLTLIGQKDGDDQAELDAVGATFGAVALIAFAVVAVSLFTVITPTVVEALLTKTRIRLVVSIVLLAVIATIVAECDEVPDAKQPPIGEAKES